MTGNRLSTLPDFSSATSGANYPGVYDYIAVTYPTTTTEVYTYKTGGASGDNVAVVTITYTDLTKCDISSVARA